MMEFTAEEWAYMDEIVTRYLNNGKDSGGKGRSTEVITRGILNAVIERAHPLGVADITRKSRGSVEVKTGCGWLVNPCYWSKEEALQEIANGLPNFKSARYVAYAPNIYIDSSMTISQMVATVTASMRVYTHREFLNVIAGAGLFVAKRSSAGQWGVSIQQFRNSMRREALFYCLLENNGMSLLEFAEKWKG